MMSTTHSHTPAFAAFVFGALLVGFNMMNPTPASAQSPRGERALLGKTQVVSGLSALKSASHPVVTADPRFPSGEQALLGKSAPASSPVAGSAEIARPVFASLSPVDGERALLGRRKVGKREPVAHASPDEDR